MSPAEVLGHYADALATYKTADRYHRLVGWWHRELDGRPLEEVKTGEVQAALGRLTVRGLAPATVRHYLSALRLLVRWSVRDQLLPRDITDGLAIHVPDNTRIRWLQDDEEAKLRAVVWPPRWSRIEFALLTGLRLTEQFVMRREAVDLSIGTVTVLDGKGGKSRVIPLSARAWGIVEGQLGGHSSDFVWPGEMPSTAGTHYGRRSANGLLQRAARRAGIAPLSWHCLRHTFATRLVRAGVDIRTIAELLGHSNIQMTMRYLRVDPARSRAAVELLGGVVGRVPAGAPSREAPGPSPAPASGQDIAEARGRRGLSQRDLAALSGVPQHIISRIELGKAAPLGALDKLRGALGLAP